VPEVAAREHVLNILPVIDEALLTAKITPKKLDLIAVTKGPGLITSLITGMETVRTLAFAWDKAVVEVNHIAGHIFSNFINVEQISILDYIDKHFQLTQKEYITLGIIVSEKRILSTQLAIKLQLTLEDKMKSWLGRLVGIGVVVATGMKKATEYMLNPELFSKAKLDIKPNLITIEPYKLEALLVEDLKYNGKSKMKDIQSRLKEIPKQRIQKTVYQMVDKQVFAVDGAKRNRKYSLFQK